VNVWDPERVVDEGLARALLRDQFPDLALESVQPLGVGWDVTVYLVDGTWAVRFPRREVAVPTLLREIALLPSLAPRLPLPSGWPARSVASCTFCTTRRWPVSSAPTC
jgi:aminoglycoside phosphotransferase (APT) family kinase protein